MNTRVIPMVMCLSMAENGIKTMWVMKYLTFFLIGRHIMVRFSILQVLPKTLSPEEVIGIESMYKEKLMSIEFGMNAN